MACSSGPNVVDDGLVAAYDAANTKSYSGSALINRYYTQTGNSANTNIWDKVGLSASANVAIDSSRGTWNGNTIFKATVPASGSYLSYQSIRKCIDASHNTAIGSSRRLTFKVRMLEPSSTAISNISYHNGGGTAGHNSSHFTLLDESEVPEDSIIKDNWYLLELSVDGTYSSGHCVGIGLPSAHSQAVTFLFTELMVYSSGDSGSEPQPFTPTERSATDGFKDMISTNDGDLNGTYQHNDNKKSIVFDGSNDYIDCGSVVNLGNTFTVKVITKVDSFSSTWNPLIFRDGNTNNNFGLRFDDSGYIEFRQYAGTELRQGPYSHSTWYDICVTVNNLVAKLYVNGQQVGSSHTFSNNFSDTGNIRLGIYSYSSGSYYDGNIAQALVYNKALSATEVKQNFNALRDRYGI